MQHVALIKEPVTKLCEHEHLQKRDWSLDPELFLDAQDIYHAATVEAWPRGEKVLKWLDPNDEPTSTYAGSYIMATRSDWLSRHLHKSLTEYKEPVGIHPTRSLEAVSHLALREKLFKFVFKKLSLSYKASTPPVWGQDKPRKAEPTVKCPDCGKMCHTLWSLRLHRRRRHPDTYTTGIEIR